MKITFLGTAGSIISKERTYPSILIEDNLLLDCGEGTTQKLLNLEIIENIKVICITHLHNDHFMGIFSLLWYYWINEREESLIIIGPPKIEETINKILDLTNTPERMKSFHINFYALKNTDKTQTIKKHNYTINAIKVNHLENSYAYRIEIIGIKDKSVCYTGDTKPNEGYINLFQNCDLLIHETTFPDEFQELAHQLYHSTPSDIAEIAIKIRCDKVALVHISPSFYDQINDFYKAVRKSFSGYIYIPDDMTEIEI